LAGAPAAVPAVKEKKKNRRKKDGYSFGSENDIVGIVMLEIKSAEDLPRLKNSTCQSFIAVSCSHLLSLF